MHARMNYHKDYHKLLTFLFSCYVSFNSIVDYYKDYHKHLFCLRDFEIDSNYHKNYHKSFIFTRFRNRL